uniref:Secreted protein n=1 Tax=Haemonchus placei TaxID=6290 RepID=A0A0N4WDN2_HAEPC
LRICSAPSAHIRGVPYHIEPSKWKRLTSALVILCTTKSCALLRLSAVLDRKLGLLPFSASRRTVMLLNADNCTVFSKGWKQLTVWNSSVVPPTIPRQGCPLEIFFSENIR